MILYSNLIDSITEEKLSGFFVEWLNPPSPEMHLNILEKSSHRVLALDDETGNVVGFITAVSDNVLAAYIPFLEVLPEYQHQGIGTELLQRMMNELSTLYMIDLLCDSNIKQFYEKIGMKPAFAMSIRNYKFQSGMRNDK